VGAFGLPDWQAVAAQGDWPALLAGNGASRAVSGAFDYKSLLVAAGLGENDQALFDQLGTSNFEEVLRALDFAVLVQQQLGHNPAPVLDRRLAIQNALVATVNNHHVAWTDVEGDRLAAIKAALLSYKSVFSTSYDLIFYWAVNQGGPAGFLDHLWHDADLHFDPNDSPVWGEPTVVHWIHGALHLYEFGIGQTAKRVNLPDAALLAQFASGGKLPLYVAEGTAQQKRAKIASSEYLAFCLNSLEAETRDLVIFGQALSDSDLHLVEALKLHPERRIAYAIYPVDQLQVDADRSKVAQVIGRDDIQFFDSKTHPLGDPGLFVA
ncbi:unnamed protein product, partial [Phaeothamnion confervicola]